MLSIIVATAHRNAIGRHGDLPFHLSPDLRHFKEVTLGKPVIMGRKTFESLPKGALPGRRNIVITRQSEYQAPEIETVGSLEEALALVADAPEAMIIGGGEIYRQALPLVDRVYLTEVDADVDEADTFFPPIPSAFTPTSTTPFATDPKTLLAYRFLILDRTR